MVIILEGPDNVGKGTQCDLIKKWFIDVKLQSYHYVHYSAVANTDLAIKQYCEMFDLINYANSNNINLIIDRAHFGEYVYGQIYRENEAAKFINKFEYIIKDMNKVVLLLFLDTAENLVHRDDGLSISIALDKKSDELKRFTETYIKSNIHQKLLININEIGNADAVYKYYLNFINHI